MYTKIVADMYSKCLFLIVFFAGLIKEDVVQGKKEVRHVSKKEAAPSSPAAIPVEILYRDYVVPPRLNHPFKTVDLHALAAENPLLAALLLSYSLGIAPKTPGFNHAQHLPTNPYVALLLSHYGKYVPAHGHARGIYGYTAANNYHNNLPFGAYKIYEDRDT